jgi:phosphatidyl-myo-inositol dimannoside synthase
LRRTVNLADVATNSRIIIRSKTISRHSAAISTLEHSPFTIHHSPLPFTIHLKTLFLTLRTFSATGGIEKVCRIMGKALYEDSLQNDGLLQVCSMYDKQQDAFDNPYFPSENFLGFGINKLRFTRQMIKAGAKNDLVVLSHINLLLIGALIKKRSPRTRIILIAHGIEVWKLLSSRKRRWLQQCDTIIAVSSFTANKIMAQHGVAKEKCIVLNNCLGPYLPLPATRKKSEALLSRYQFSVNDTILITLSRLRSAERYKGYDKVIEAMALLKLKYPGIKYILAGSYDAEEKAWIDRLIQQSRVQDNVVLPGYIEEEELQDHFALSDIYIMPSRGEGFGIVFIEAMYYGLPVIAGNTDGSVDALLNGELGQLVNPGNVEEIKNAIANIIENKTSFTPSRKVLIEHFSYEAYKEKLEELISLTPDPSPQGEGDRKTRFKANPSTSVYPEPVEGNHQP